MLSGFELYSRWVPLRNDLNLSHVVHFQVLTIQACLVTNEVFVSCVLWIVTSDS